MKKSIMTVTFFLFSAFWAFTQYSYDWDSDEVVELKVLYGQAGLAFPTSSFPLFLEDLQRLTDALMKRLDGGPLLRAASSLASALAVRSGMAVTAMPAAEYQRFLGFPEGPVPFSDLLAREKPLIELGLGMQLNGVTLVIKDVTQKKYALGMSESNYTPIIPGSEFSRENNSIREGYLRFLVGPFDVVVGRQPVHLGPAEEQSLVMSMRIPFLDAVKVRLFAGPMTMTFLLSTLENRQAQSDVWTSTVSGYDYGDTVILYNIHYFEWSFGSIRAGIGSQYLVSRPYNALQLADFFPVFSWHNADIAPNNLCVFADVSWIPFPGLSLYAQVGFDDINLNTFGAADSVIPTIDAEIVGISLAIDLEQGWPLDVSITGGHTHYLWGNWDFLSPQDNYLSRAIYRMDLWDTVLSTPLTSPFGPGAWWASIRALLTTPWGGSASIGASYILKNPLANLETTPYMQSEDIRNAPLDQYFSVTLELGYSYANQFTIGFSPTVWLDPESLWLSLAFGVSVALTTH